MCVPAAGMPSGFFAPSSSAPTCACFFETEFFSETCSFSIAGCEKITTIVTQQVIRMHFIAAHQFESLDVARAQLQVAVARAARLPPSARWNRLSAHPAPCGTPWSSASFTSNALTTISLPSANFDASAERNAPSSFLRGNV